MKKKIFEIDELRLKLKKLKNYKPSMKVVLCHGVFDIIHIGHIRYFKEAKKKGNFLIVSVTADKYVNKGIGRPYFKSSLRLEFLSSIKEIDAICISNNASAVSNINKIKPNYYLKGPDFKNLQSDLSKKIYAEKKAVEKNGGKLIFSKDITFSSSSIINAYFDKPNEINQKFINRVKKTKFTNELINNINKISKLKILVLGETIIDKYTISEPLGKPGKDAHLVVKNKNDKTFIGGAAAVAKNISSFCKNVTFISFIGEKKGHLSLLNKNLKNIKKFLIYKKNSPTIVKKRFIDEITNRKLFGEYFLNDKLISKNDETKILNYLNKKKYDLIILLDYGHGLITKNISEKIKKHSNFIAVNAQINSSNIGHHSIKKFRGSSLLLINESELRHEVRDKESNLISIAKKFKKENKFKNIIVTSGYKGSLLVENNQKTIECPAFENKEVIDKVGAGDTMLSIVAPLFYLKNNSHTSILIGNLSGAISVRNFANSVSLDKLKLINYYKTILK